MAGDLIQIEAEILEVTATSGGGTVYTVARGSHGSTAATHLAAVLIYHLARNVTIVPFVNGFFGSPASGSYSHSIFLPDVRVGAAEFFVTNSIGGGPVAGGVVWGDDGPGAANAGGRADSIQVEGYLAIQTDAAPPLIVEDSCAVRDMFAVVNEAPSGGAIRLQLRHGSTVFCSSDYRGWATTSNVVDGFGLVALAAGAQLSLDIVSVPTAVGTFAGERFDGDYQAVSRLAIGRRLATCPTRRETNDIEKLTAGSGFAVLFSSAFGDCGVEQHFG